MPRLNACPDVAAFHRLAAGALPAPDTEALLDHLERCEACAQRLDALPGQETLLELLRHGKTHGATPAPDDVSRLVARLSKLPPIAAPSDIIFRCACGKNLQVKHDAAGKKVKCPSCQKISVVASGPPRQSETPTLAPPDATPPNSSMASTQDTISLHQKNDGTILSAQAHDAELTECLAPPQAADELGRLGPYRILKILGAGGMGVVYQAEDPQLKRLVAIKAMLPSLGASSSNKKRFLREAQSAAAIKHDHIVSIYQVGEERGVPFLAMEFLLGESLDARLKRDKKLPAPDILRIGSEIAEGLSAAHEAGLIHRDIKPANIWLEGKKARVKILDFGLARASDEHQQLTQRGAIVGTPAYMAPEQAQGQPIDQRCDLFSLGTVLYRLCTGRQPFVGADTVSTLVAVSTHEPEPPAKLNADIPVGLSDLVMKLLAKDPAQRFSSAEEVAQALRQLQGQPIDTAALPVAAPIPTSRKISDTVIFETPTVTPVKPAAAPRKRRPMVPIAIAILAMSLCVLIAGGVIVYRLFLQTPNGQLIVETEGDAKIAFEKGKLLIFEPGSNTPLYTLFPHEAHKNLPLGKYKLKIVDAQGVELSGNDFEMTKKGWTVRVRLATDGPLPQKTPAVAASPQFAEKGVHDFAEIHDADETRFDAWIAQMKTDGFRPVRLTVQTVKDSPRYTAVALKDDKDWPWDFSRVDQEVDGHASGYWKKKFEAVAVTLYRDRGKTREAYLWAKDQSLDNNGLWFGDAGYIEGKLKNARKAKTRLISRSAVFVGSEPRFCVLIEDPDGVPWQESYTLSFADLKEYVEKHKADGWRPDHFCYYAVGAKRLFAAVLIKDPNKTDWDISWSLPVTDFENELRARKAQGFRPLTTLGHEDDTGVQRFSVIWIRYRLSGGANATTPTPMPQNGAEKGVLDFAEIHDADEERFDAWITQMKKDNFCPASLSVQMVQGAPRFTAVALKEEKKKVWEISRVLNTNNRHIDEMWAKDYVARADCFYRSKGELSEAMLWIWDPNGNNHGGIWSGGRQLLADKIDDARNNKCRPLHISALADDTGTHFTVVMTDQGPLPCVEAVNQSLDACKAYVEKQKAHGWRPDHLCAYGAGAKTLFGVILLQDPHGPAWDVSWALTPNQYEAELGTRKKQGFRPHTAVAHEDDDGARRFSVTWIRFSAADGQPKPNERGGGWTNADDDRAAAGRDDFQSPSASEGNRETPRWRSGSDEPNEKIGFSEPERQRGKS